MNRGRKRPLPFRAKLRVNRKGRYPSREAQGKPFVPLGKPFVAQGKQVRASGELMRIVEKDQLKRERSNA